MNYVLERQGDEWHIKSRTMDMHGKQQPGQTALPPGHPGMSAAPNAGTPLPPGHPQLPRNPKQ
jgi:hypothetical protein